MNLRTMRRFGKSSHLRIRLAETKIAQSLACKIYKMIVFFNNFITSGIDTY